MVKVGVTAEKLIEEVPSDLDFARLILFLSIGIIMVTDQSVSVY